MFQTKTFQILLDIFQKNTPQANMKYTKKWINMV